MGKKTWQEAVVLARRVRAGEVPSYHLAAIDLADYILHEQESIDVALANTVCPEPFVSEEPLTSPETPMAKVTTNPYPPPMPAVPPPLECDSLDDDTEETTYFFLEGKERTTGVLAAPETGIRVREVLPDPRHNDEDDS